MDRIPEEDPPNRERRTQARRGAWGVIGLEVELIVGPGQVFRGRVLDTSAGGARVALGAGAPPRFYLGTRVEVRFVQPGVGRPLVAQAQVANQGTQDGATTLGVRFVEREAFYRQLTPELWRQFNRRRRSRLRFRTDPAFPARIGSGERSWKAPITDLSTLGMGAEVEPLESEALARFELVRVRIELPGEDDALDLVATQVHQTEFGHGVRHGLRFDPSLSADLVGQQVRLETFLRRQLARMQG
jgi:c-di-GMP-binding flagellar brake protein YcgR